MERFLKIIDLFPYNFGLTFKKQKSYQTEFGGCVSIIYLILILVCAIIFSENLRKKKDPKLVFREDLYHENNILEKLTNENFVFGVFMKDVNPELIIYENLFKINALYEDTDKKTHIMKLGKCEEIYKNNKKLEHLFEEHNKLFSYGVCLDMDSANTKTKIDPYKTRVQFEIKCKKKERSNCVYDKELRNLMLNTTLELYLFDTFFDANNADNPLKESVKMQDIYMNPELERFFHIGYEALRIETDNGFFLENSIFDSSLNAEEIYKKEKLNNYDSDYKGEITILTVEIFFQNRIRSIKRVYTKIQDVFASMAGIMNILTIAGKIIVSIYSSFAFDQDLINSIFKKKHIDDSIFKKHYLMELKVKNDLFNNDKSNSNMENKFKLSYLKSEQREDNYKFYQVDSKNKNNTKSTLNKIDADSSNELRIIDNKNNINNNQNFDNSCFKTLKSGIANESGVSPSSDRYVSKDEKDIINIEPQRKSIIDKLQDNSDMKDIILDANEKNQANLENSSNSEKKASKFKLYMEKMDSKNNFMSFSLTELVRRCLFTENNLPKELQEKNKLFKAYIDELSYTREIDKVIEMQFKFDFIQFVLLDEHHRYAFNHIRYLSIYEKQKEEKAEDHDIMKMFKLENHFKELLNGNGNVSKIDKKILSNLNEEMIGLFME